MFDASTATLLARASSDAGIESLYRQADGGLILQVIGGASEQTHAIVGRCCCRSETPIDQGQATQWLRMAQTETAH